MTLKGAPKNKFGEAVVHFQGVPDFSPRRELIPGPAAGPGAFPPASATPGPVGDARYSPFTRRGPHTKNGDERDEPCC